MSSNPPLSFSTELVDDDLFKSFARPKGAFRFSFSLPPQAGVFLLLLLLSDGRFVVEVSSANIFFSVISVTSVAIDQHVDVDADVVVCFDTADVRCIR